MSDTIEKILATLLILFSMWLTFITYKQWNDGFFQRVQVVAIILMSLGGVGLFLGKKVGILAALTASFLIVEFILLFLIVLKPDYRCPAPSTKEIVYYILIVIFWCGVTVLLLRRNIRKKYELKMRDFLTIGIVELVLAGNILYDINKLQELCR